MSQDAPNPLEAPLPSSPAMMEESQSATPTETTTTPATNTPTDLLSGDPVMPDTTNTTTTATAENEKDDDDSSSSSSGSSSSSSGESSSSSDNDEDEKDGPTTRQARRSKPRRYRDEPLEVEQGNDDDYHDDDYDENFEQEHDQLPSAEEIKASIMGPRRSGRRFLSVLRRLCDFTTFALTCFLIALIMIFLFSLLIPEFINRDHDATEYDPDENIDNGDFSETPATEPPQYSLIAATLINNGIALANGGEFTNSGTYQSKALAFLELPEHSSIYERYDITQLQSVYALLCLYYHTNPQETSWHPSLKWLHTTDYCKWTGVYCGHRSAVQRLDLANGGLSGSLPVELMHLESTLTDLLLDDNPGLTGQIPSFLGEMDLSK